MPEEHTPAYNIGVQASRVASGAAHSATFDDESSKISIGTALIIAQVKNCMQDILTPSTSGEKRSIVKICIAKTTEHKSTKISEI